jgi:hypothetical protein
VFALLVPSCQQVWNKLLQPCWYYQICCKVVPTSPIQSWYNNILTTLCRQPCNSLFQTCYNNWEQAVRTQLDDSLYTDL